MTTTPNDHLTIEQRLGRLESAVRLLNIKVDEIDDFITHGINEDSGFDEAILQLDERVSALENAAKEDDDEPDDRKIYIGFKDKDKPKDKDHD